jgi:hypothetical protein
MVAAPAACQCSRLDHGRMLSVSVGGSGHEASIVADRFGGTYDRGRT